MTRIAIFSTCFNDTLFPGTISATEVLLRTLGFNPEFPPSEACCGQMHINSGYPRLAVPMARNFVSSFQEYDFIVSPSASCVGSVRHQMAQVAASLGDTDLSESVSNLATRVLDFTEFVIDIAGVEDVGATFPHTVTYHTSCHSLRALQVGDRPLRLLKAVKNIQYVPLEDSQSCCGFGGTFSVKNGEVSAAMMNDKIDAAVRSDVEWIVSGDNSCLLHLNGGLSRRGVDIRSAHLVEILAGSIV